MLEQRTAFGVTYTPLQPGQWRLRWHWMARSRWSWKVSRYPEGTVYLGWMWRIEVKLMVRSKA